MALRRNILFRYFTEYAIYEDFLKDVTKANIFINLKIITLITKQLLISRLKKINYYITTYIAILLI